MKFMLTVGEKENTIGLIMCINDVLCTVFSVARYSKALEENNGFEVKDCLSLTGLE